MVRVLLADDHEIVRTGLKNFLEAASDIEVVGEARCGQEVLYAVAKLHLDVVVLDISMPEGDGLDILAQIKRNHPNLPVIFYTMHPETRYGIRALKVGAAGYVTKGSDPRELVKAIRKVSRGFTFISEHLTTMLTYGLRLGDGKPIHETLSPREYQIMRMIAGGKSTKEIAGDLSISVGTVYTHRERILEKMRMRTNVEITHYAVLNGLVD
ncbi:MAG: response regulator transcription factor [Ignavibacteriae bacterium]|nr:response regulator transcription factor [Ignavibacteriota bacterium]